METRQLPLPFVPYKHQRRTQLSQDGGAAIGGILDETADHDSCIVVIDAHHDLIQRKGVVLQVAGLKPRDPLLLGQQESEISSIGVAFHGRKHVHEQTFLG